MRDYKTTPEFVFLESSGSRHETMQNSGQERQVVWGQLSSL